MRVGTSCDVRGWVVGVLAVVGMTAGTAQAYYHPRVGRWLQRDPLVEAAALNPRLANALRDAGPVLPTSPAGAAASGLSGAWNSRQTEAQELENGVRAFARSQRTFCLLTPPYHGPGRYLMVCSGNRTISMKVRGILDYNDQRGPSLSARPLELYEYCRSSPVGHVDPAGLEETNYLCSESMCESYAGCGSCHDDHGIKRWTRSCSYKKNMFTGKLQCGCYAGGDY